MNAPFSRPQDVTTVQVSQAAEGLPRRAFTIDDLEAMEAAGIVGHDERLELVGGEIVPMSAKGSRHEQIKVALNLLWGRAAPDGYAFAPETGLRLDPYNYLEPDFILFRTDRPLKEVKGPDILLVVEVADSSLDYDLRRKPLTYAHFGVRELWVIDAARRRTHVHIDPTPEGFAQTFVRAGNERLVPAAAPAEFAFTLDELPRI